MKNIRIFYLKIFHFLVVNFSAYLNKLVFVMYIENFTTKIGKFQIKNSDIFHITGQNIDCVYYLEPPRKIMYTPVYPSFTI